jgi:hypothetical protein
MQLLCDTFTGSADTDGKCERSVCALADQFGYLRFDCEQHYSLTIPGDKGEQLSH